MAEPRTRKERRDFLTERAIRFFDLYGDELESISQVLQIRLDQLASAYTVENKLPRKAVVVQSRVKSLTSFLSLFFAPYQKNRETKTVQAGRPILAKAVELSPDKRKRVWELPE